MSFAFAQENNESRRKLETLARRLTDQDLARTTPYGWTVAALLAHIAFWDQRVLSLLRRWKTEGVDASPIDSTAINDALKPLCHALPPRAALELCLSSAKAVDDELETVTPEFIAQIEKQVAANPFQFRPNRSLHRNDHVKDIEELLKQQHTSRG